MDFKKLLEQSGEGFKLDPVLNEKINDMGQRMHNMLREEIEPIDPDNLGAEDITPDFVDRQFRGMAVGQIAIHQCMIQNIQNLANAEMLPQEIADQMKAMLEVQQGAVVGTLINALPPEVAERYVQAIPKKGKPDLRVVH